MRHGILHVFATDTMKPRLAMCEKLEGLDVNRVKRTAQEPVTFSLYGGCRVGTEKEDLLKLSHTCTHTLYCVQVFRLAAGCTRGKNTSPNHDKTWQKVKRVRRGIGRNTRMTILRYTTSSETRVEVPSTNMSFTYRHLLYLRCRSRSSGT